MSTSPEWVRPFNITVYILTTVFMVAGLLLYWRSRTLFPIKERGVLENTGLAVSWAVWGLTFAIGDYMPCALDMFLYSMAGLCGCFFWNARLVRLLFRFKIQDAFFHQRPSWFIRYKFLTGWKMLRWQLVLIAVVEFLLLTASGLISRGEIFRSYGNCSPRDNYMFSLSFQVLIMGQVLFGIFLSCFMGGQYADAHKMRKEIFFSGTLTCICFILYQVFLRIDILHLYGIHTFIGISVINVWTSFSLMWPLMLTKHAKSARMSHQLADEILQVAKGLELLHFLSSSRARASFRWFLRSEFSVENIMFWERATAWQAQTQRHLPVSRKSNASNVPDDDDTYQSLLIVEAGMPSGVSARSSSVAVLSDEELVSECKNIISQFLALNATEMVNVSSNVRAKVTKVCALPNPDLEQLQGVFDDACAQVLKLMSTDSWPRYKRSKYFVRLLENRKVLQELVACLEADSASTSRSVSVFSMMTSNPSHQLSDKVYARDGNSSET